MKRTPSLMTSDLYVLSWKSSYDVTLLMCKRRQQHFSEFWFVWFLDQGYARIYFYVIFRPGICKNIFLCSVLHWRIIRIKRFFSGVHACVHSADALTNFTFKRPKTSVFGRLCKVCECIGTVYTCMNSWKDLKTIFVFWRQICYIS